MPKTTTYNRSSWEDRFNRPTVKQLRSGLSSDERQLFDALLKKLLELDGVEEGLAWYGESWKWTIELHTKLSDEPLAVIVPCPGDLQLAVPLDAKFTRSLSVKRMKRAVRDGLELAQEPFDARWGIWSVQAKSLLEDLRHLVELKLRHLAKAAG